MKTSSAKAKGRKLQQHVAKVISETFELEEGDVESRPMGSSGEDVMLSAAARKVFPFSTECKNTKTFPSVGALRQSQANKRTGAVASVVWKPHGKGLDESIIYFNFKEFVEWLKSQEKDCS